jgi:hypothetical protein
MIPEILLAAAIQLSSSPLQLEPSRNSVQLGTRLIAHIHRRHRRNWIQRLWRKQ